MNKYVYFDAFHGDYWPAIDQLKPYFFTPPGEAWFDTGGNDSASIKLEGIDGTEHMRLGFGRKDIHLYMWGNRGLGVLLQYARIGGGVPRQDWFSKGDMSKSRQWVRSLHDTPLPIGLFIPFDRAWLAVKEFMETEGKLPSSIEWIKNSDLPDGTFPDPTVRLTGEDD